MIEVLTGVICSCLPVLGPVLDRMLGKNHTLWTPKSSRKSSPNSTNVDHPGQGALTKQISPSSSEGRLGVGTKSSGTTLRSDEEKLDLEAGIPSAMAEMPTGGSTMPTLPRQTYQRSSPAAAPTTNAFPSTTVSPTSDSPTARPGHGSSESGHNINRDVALTGGYRDQFSEPPYKGAGREGGGEWGEGAEGHRNQLADLRKQRLRMDESVEKKFVGGGVAL